MMLLKGLKINRIKIFNISHFQKSSPVGVIFIKATSLGLALSLRGRTAEQGEVAMQVHLYSQGFSKHFSITDLLLVFVYLVRIFIKYLYIHGSVPLVAVMLKEL